MIDLVFVGPAHRPYSKLIDEYVLRATRYHPVRATYVENSPLRRKQSILKITQQAKWLVGLDERGKSLDSMEFSGALQTWIECYRHVCFVVGDAFSLPSEVTFNATISLSAMTLPHDFARLILAEQTYRALTIQQKHPYHHV